jgi:hypothetical protein
MSCASAGYGPIRHLATILWPPWLDRAGAIFAMLTFAFDAGGDEATDYLTVAGFASSTDDWDEFSKKWKARLDRDGIEFFRATDLASFQGPFAHWHDLPDRNELRRALHGDLMGLIHSNCYHKLSCTVINKDFRETNSNLRAEFAPRAYSLAARTCEKYARKWLLEEWKYCTELTIGMVFEAGDKGSGILRQQLAIDEGHIPPSFRPKKDTSRDDGTIEYGFVPLQAADWLAWEINRAVRDLDNGRIHEESQLRWPMQEFLRHPTGYLGQYTLQNLKEMDTMLEVTEKLTSWVEGLGKDDTLDGNDANAKSKAAQ